MVDERPDDIVEDVYAAAQARGAAAVYRDWAEKYDADNAALGFRLPYLAAAFAARYLPPGDGPVLDAGCGTGQVGTALRILGHDRIVGLDLSPDMLAVARRTGAYDKLHVARLGERLPFDDDAFAGVLCIGAFGPGHAPPAALAELVRVAAAGGPVIFNLVEATWQSQGFPQVMQRLDHAGRWQQVEVSAPFRPYTLGEEDLQSRMFVYRALR